MEKSELTKLFTISNEPIILSDGQTSIFNEIIEIKHKRVQIIAPTQYGKSMVIALAVLLRALSCREKWVILAPSEKKVQIIMGYILEHIFDRSEMVEQLEIDKTINLDRLRRERSRSSINFKRGGGVMTLSLDAKNGRRNIEAVMGFGGNRLVLDESSLIPDNLYSTVKRMLGGYKYEDTFMLEIGNPFYRNHFLRTWEGVRYHKIFIDYHQGLEEGRYSPEFIDEMREEAFFSVFYDCKFPDESEIDLDGYRLLMPSSDVSKSIIPANTNEVSKTARLGVDVGAGADLSVFVMRDENVAWVEHASKSRDTMGVVSEIESIIEKYHLAPENVFIDDIGIGRGVTDRLKEKQLKVNAVAVGAIAMDKVRYGNIKAENYWGIKQWLDAGGKLIQNDSWSQLSWIKYKVNTDKVIMIQPKDELKKTTGKSPDFAEALMLTFTRKLQPNVRFV